MTNHIPRLAAQSLEAFNPGANFNVYALALQADRKILVGGGFNSLGGDGRNRIGRLHADGTLDTGFDPRIGGLETVILTILVQPDGKIVVGGKFTIAGGQARSCIARLHPDGTVDGEFNPRANDYVWALAAQPDGKILVGGTFSSLGGQVRSRIARINLDGSLDPGFNPGASGGGGASGVYAFAQQADGKVLVGGAFGTFGGQTRNRLARLNPDGSLDLGFAPTAGGTVNSIVVQPDGKILVGGFFGFLNAQERNRMGRLEPDGTLDGTFNPAADDVVNSLAMQTDGKILVGGRFLTLGGQPRDRIGRINPDGTLDSTFSPVADDEVRCLALNVDGKVLLGGNFTLLGGETRRYIGLLNNTEPATGSLTYDGSRITWLRGGTSPEVWGTSFEVLGDATNWLSLGSGSRIAGGWQSSPLVLPLNPTIRARAFVSGAFDGASGWYLETLGHGPVLTLQPTNCEAYPGQSVAFVVASVGTAPLTYLWSKDGVVLEDDVWIGGTRSATLSIAGVQLKDAGGYSVEISNSFGRVTSQLATLAVTDPLIISQPLSRWAFHGSTVEFTVNAGGTAPLSYQWRKDGENLEGQIGETLILSSLEEADSGDYDVIVSNPSGSVTSEVANLRSVSPPVPDSFAPGPLVDMFAVAPLVDGKVLMGGEGGLFRFNANGARDSAFNPPLRGFPVESLVVMPDGSLLVGSYLSSGGGPIKVTANGAIDASFNLRANGGVVALFLQPDGKILVGGGFTSLGGEPREHLGRLNTDGTIDAEFRPQVNGDVLAIALQEDGKILVGGRFTSLEGQPLGHLGRLNADGTLDSAFNPDANDTVSMVAVRADGRILVNGRFSTLGGQARAGLGRLNVDGNLDPSFNPRVESFAGVPSAASMALQANGMIFVGGRFDTLAGEPRSNIARLTADGDLDRTFDSGADNWVTSVTIQADGKILVTGFFATLGEQTRYNVGRLFNTEPAKELLFFDGSTITWSRSGTCPEVWRTTFELSSDGVSWTNPTVGMRITGGWQAQNTSLPSGARIRARGYVTGSFSANWFVERVSWPAAVVMQPLSRTNVAGTTALFTVAASGSEPIEYQWMKNGTALTDDGRVSGTSTPTLSIFDVQESDEAAYRVEVRNADGRAVRAEALLTVLGPLSIDNATLSDSAFRFVVRGDSGASIRVDVSFDLFEWAELRTIANFTGEAMMDDAATPSKSAKFYRAIRLP